MSLIYKYRPTGGKLYQCGAREIPKILRQEDINLLILAAKEFQPEHLGIHNKDFIATNRLYIPFNDRLVMSKKELKCTLKKVKTAANYGISTILNGKNVISSCHAGLNRSGIISGLIIIELAGCSASEAVDVIRQNRSPDALFNPLFVEQLDILTR